MNSPYSSHTFSGEEHIISAYRHFIENATYPCIAAKAAITKGHLRFFVAADMENNKDDISILQFLYHFVDEYRAAKDMYHSAVIIFKHSKIDSEEKFDELLWKRLQSLCDLDAASYAYDPRVSSDPSSPSFSFSLKGEAFYIIGLHPHSNRASRKFEYAALVFNPHAQFETLRKMMKYDVMKTVVRKRDVLYSGSANPMLEDFGKSSEVFQYSGRNYNNNWVCPLKVKHGSIERHSST